jgi:hypothetical protein
MSRIAYFLLLFFAIAVLFISNSCSKEIINPIDLNTTDKFINDTIKNALCDKINEAIKNLPYYKTLPPTDYQVISSNGCGSYLM